MKVKLRNPDRVVDVSGPKTVVDLLKELNIVPEAVLVIRDATLLTRDERLTESDVVEVRPVLSGGANGATLHGGRLSERASASDASRAERGGGRMRRRSGSGASPT